MKSLLFASGIVIGAFVSFAVVLFVVIGAALIRSRAARHAAAGGSSRRRRTSSSLLQQTEDNKQLMTASVLLTGGHQQLQQQHGSPDLVTSLPSRGSPYVAYDKGKSGVDGNLFKETVSQRAGRTL